MLNFVTTSATLDNQKMRRLMANIGKSVGFTHFSCLRAFGVRGTRQVCAKGPSLARLPPHGSPCLTSLPDFQDKGPRETPMAHTQKLVNIL